MRIDRGTTLIEALVYTALFGLVLSCIYWVLIASMRYYHIANDSIELQQNGLVALSTITQELSESQANSIYSFSDPDGIIFASPRNSSNQFTYGSLTQKLQWSKWVCYYVGSNGGNNYLYKKEYFKQTPEETPVVPTDHDTVAEFAGDSDLSQRTVCKYIDNIQFTLTGEVVTINALFKKSPNPEIGNELEIQSETKERNK